MTRAEYQAVRRRVYEAKRAVRIEADDDGRSSYGSKSIRENAVLRDLQSALARDPRHQCDKSIDPYGYFDSRRYEWRAHVRRHEVTKLLAKRHAGTAGPRDTGIMRLYLKPIREKNHD